ncbi:MAG: cobalt transporter CbiM [Chloroflexota bacterium]|nr:cobalt transporter CbiM [Chloroflexota bacterium]
MHIPDGYLSPATAAVMYAAALPFWYRATRKIRKLVTGRLVPLIALFAALSFVIMMFNVPLPGGTTGHAVGSVLAAIVLGPWAASLAVSVALIIQAFFFGDGGILAIGANAFNMAIAMPFVGYFLYRLLSGNAAITSTRRVIAGAIAGYFAINVGALLTGIELGIQPLLFRDAAGHALYFPYGLNVSIPAMLIGHLTIAGAVEAIATSLVLAWLQRTNPQLLEATSGARTQATPTGLPRWAWAGLLALLALTPLGLLAPGTAWGEWSRAELEQIGLGYIPSGFDKWSSLWNAPLSGYDLAALKNPTVGYLLSAILGVGLVVIVVSGFAWLLQRTERLQPARSESRTGTLPPRVTQAAQRKRAARGFFEKTLGDITGTLEQTLFAEEIARQPGLLQSLDPRAKLVGALALLIAVSASQHLLVIAALYALTLPVAAASRVPMGFYLKRVWVFMPFFTGVVALPALFSPFSPGAPLVTLIDLASPRLYLAITQPGVVTAALLLLRVGASVSIAVLLILTTRWATLLKALRVLRVPQAFVLILGMTYRYIYVLLHAANNMFLARKSRVVGRISAADDRRWLTASMGTLFAKSYELSDQVYLAMQSRGFRGEAQVMDALTWREADWLWLAAFVAVAAGAVWVGR